MRRNFPILLLLGCLAGFVVGFYELVKLRFESGDVYAEYSSLRADPLGTMLLYESLQRLPGISVRRDFSASNELPGGKEVTYLHLAATQEEWTWVPEELVQELDGFLARGGRLIVTFFPENRRSFNLRATGTNPPTVPGKKQSKKAKQEEEHLLRRTSLTKQWGMEFQLLPLEKEQGITYKPAQVNNQSDLVLPETLAWHSALVLTNLGPAWRTIYARGTNAVMVERGVGAGTVVLATDSYFLSNEALRKERHADLLAWLVGSGRHIVFDEAHLGNVDTSGVATLIRKYRLHGFVAGLILLAVLFIWKNSFSLVPAYPVEMEPDQLTGKDAAAGFINLLRRNIAPRHVLRVCFDEWTKTLLRDRSHSIARVDQAQEILEAEVARAETGRNPIQTYRDIARVLKGPPRSGGNK